MREVHALAYAFHICVFVTDLKMEHITIIFFERTQTYKKEYPTKNKCTFMKEYSAGKDRNHDW